MGEPISDSERQAIRREALAVLAAFEEAKEKRRPPARQAIGAKLLDVLANGFLVLIVGSFITYVAVPHFQRKHEQRDLAVKTQQECLALFLSYANSVWREYYLIVPLAPRSNLTRQEYEEQARLLTQIKLDRYQSYARLEALAISFRGERDGSKPSPKSAIEADLYNYAVEINSLSKRIDHWLGNLRCATGGCTTPVPTAEQDSFSEFERIKSDVSAFNKKSEALAEKIVHQIELTAGED